MRLPTSAGGQGGGGLPRPVPTTTRSSPAASRRSIAPNWSGTAAVPAALRTKRAAAARNKPTATGETASSTSVALEPVSSSGTEGGVAPPPPAVAESGGAVVARWAAAFRRNLAGETKPAPRQLTDVQATFFTHPSVLIVLLALAALGGLRVQLPFSPADAAVAAGVALVWLLQEWVIHAKLLHSDFEWIGKTIHEAHHREEYYHISIDPPWLIATAMALVGGIFATALPLPLAVTATAVYYSMGLLYEFNHYLVHTRYVPTSALAKRIRRHHMLHHNRNFHHWLSFTAPAVDNLFGTNPRPATVPREIIPAGAPSPQARKR